MRILIIEDNEQNLYLEQILLEAAGHTIACSIDGVEGIELAKRNQFDVILVDIQLPQFDGYETTRRLRKLKALDEVPIIAVTSYAMAGDHDKAMASGFDGYIEKPIDPDTFAKIIEQVVTEKRR